MFLKKKHISVIAFSSSIIVLVLVATLAGYHLYIQWKQDTLALRYRNSISELTAKIFRNDIVLSNMEIKIEKQKGEPSVPLLQGNIKNNSGRKIGSVSIEITLENPDGTVAYKEWVDPLGDDIPGVYMSPLVRVNPKEALMPGEDISFRYFMKNCPHEVKEKMLAKSAFAKEGTKGSLKMKFFIVGLVLS
ncbi:MAG: hypothetical protein ABIG55_06945 [Candidatus Omnitrophota bacterium]|nr:hypothetical protein [Candidatus Omnitrophota bacterium]